MKIQYQDKILEVTKPVTISQLLEKEIQAAHCLECSTQEQAVFYRDHVAKAMEKLRKPADALEMLVDEVEKLQNKG